MRRMIVIGAVMVLIAATAFAQVRTQGPSPGASSSGRLGGPRNAAPFYERGRNFAERGDWERAVADLRRAVEIEEDNVDALILLGRGYRELRDPEQSLRYYLLVVRYRPGMGDAHVAIGELALMRDDVTLALQHYFILRDARNPRAEDLFASIERYVRART